MAFKLVAGMYLQCIAANGHVEVVEWLLLNSSIGFTSDVVEKTATKRFHISRLNFCYFGIQSLDKVVENGNFVVLRWLYQNTSTERLDIVMWLHRLPLMCCTTAAMDNAAAGGYLKVMQWLLATRTEGRTVKALKHAATNDHISVVKWLLANRSKHSNPAIFSAMERAIMGEHLEVMWYLDAQRSDHTLSLDELRDRLLC
ncbi:hypothetical protein PHMEG_00019345 [Phytophthora megakarya]|uniref:Uncharacterized protein n=1 Tax=Phytophthora megakarya TaxID=4795 RepID=A0A225VTM6_9STRA|nr:hypothetical protein PHMEG_00019345 [Phytophthora megakarya]